MKSQGEIEAAICEGITRFEQEYMGRGPTDVHAQLISDLLVVLLDVGPADGKRDVLKGHGEIRRQAQPIPGNLVEY